jgi:3-methyladenine DNA glycosylase/8-oxoguanine DNA glycosylase
MPERSLSVVGSLDLVSTLAPLRHGIGDPTVRLAPGQAWLATRTPQGPAALHVHQQGAVLQAQAWGEGADWALGQLPDLVGAGDDVSGFRPRHRVVELLWRDRPGLRIPRTGAVYEALLPTVLEQRVTGFEARRAYHQLIARWGEPAPGPLGLLLPPAPEVLAGIPYYELHVLGVEKKRADTLRRVGAHGARLDAVATLAPPEARARLRAIPGVGIWTAAEVALVALGDADAVPVGDFHLKHQVSWALAGEPRGSDDRMLELLEPYAGHRGRVCRLILSGGITAPRRGPRYRPQPIAAM